MILYSDRVLSRVRPGLLTEYGGFCTEFGLGGVLIEEICGFFRFSCYFRCT